MATSLITVDSKLFPMIPYIIKVKVRKFHQPTANRFSTARKKGAGVGALNRVKDIQNNSASETVITPDILSQTQVIEHVMLVYNKLIPYL